jgi:hypothetical protein
MSTAAFAEATLDEPYVTYSGCVFCDIGGVLVNECEMELGSMLADVIILLQPPTLVECYCTAL